jgi:CRP-like cAMP-binding protein
LIHIKAATAQLIEHPSMTEGINNLFLRALPAYVLAQLKPSLQYIPLSNGQPIEHVNGPVMHVYFVDRGFISLVKTMRDGRSVEVGGVGIEGVTTPTAILSSRGFALLDSMVQVPGSALRMERATLRLAMQNEPVLLRMVEDYARFQLQQVAQIAACNRLHSIEERCCRWLLTAHDNAVADRFSLTHEFMAMMLGTQRSSVSLVAKALQRAGLIDYARGVISITQRLGLEEEACECYAATQTEIKALYRNG